MVLFKTWSCPGWGQERDHWSEVVKWCCENSFSESRHYHIEHMGVNSRVQVAFKHTFHTELLKKPTNMK